MWRAIKWTVLFFGVVVVISFLIVAGRYLQDLTKKETYVNLTPAQIELKQKCGRDYKLDKVKIAAFNVENFGLSKRSKPEVMALLVRIVSEFDLVLIQELRDSKEETAEIFLQELNAKHGFDKYAFIRSPRLGPTSRKEAYAYFYDTYQVEFEKGSDYVYPNSGYYKFERAPYIAKFKSGNFDFILVGVHTAPPKAAIEIDSLDRVVRDTERRNKNERDIVVLGDLNADGRSFNERSYLSNLKKVRYHWLISNEMRTMLVGDNTNDRIVVLPSTFNFEYVSKSAGVFDYPQVYRIDDRQLVESVSDHLPVWAEFKTVLKDDD